MCFHNFKSKEKRQILLFKGGFSNRLICLNQIQLKVCRLHSCNTIMELVKYSLKKRYIKQKYNCFLLLGPETKKRYSVKTLYEKTLYRES